MLCATFKKTLLERTGYVVGKLDCSCRGAQVLLHSRLRELNCCYTQQTEGAQLLLHNRLRELNCCYTQQTEGAQLLLHNRLRELNCCYTAD